jgi:hypothetical protein
MQNMKNQTPSNQFCETKFWKSWWRIAAFVGKNKKIVGRIGDKASARV